MIKVKVHEQHKQKGPKEIRIGLVIVSTSRFQEMQEQKPSTDETIPLVKDILENSSELFLSRTSIVSDDAEQIQHILSVFIEDDTIQAIIFSGGTGLSMKDITYETIEPLLEKQITGFGEIFRYLSFKEIGSSAMLSRATAGKIKDKVVFLLPGSPKAVELALKELIIPELRHILYIVNKKE